MEQITKRFFNWASILEEGTRAQVPMTSEMPFIFPHVALMPNAYKDIDVVMMDAEDLVEIRHTLRQIVNVKGD